MMVLNSSILRKFFVDNNTSMYYRKHLEHLQLCPHQTYTTRPEPCDEQYGYFLYALIPTHL